MNSYPTYTSPCSICNSTPDAQTGDYPNIGVYTLASNTLYIILCPSCIEEIHHELASCNDALDEDNRSRRSIRPLFGTSVTYRERT